ncbi:MAG: tetratricopeptide repeat protein [Bacteroidia bacterium]|nr:tetratricopeptide repeat protein [Bacteroidia bacterium]
MSKIKQDTPQKEVDTPSIISNPNHPIFKKIFWGLTTILLFALPILSTDIGSIGDERCQVPYSEMVLDFYLTLGEDRSCIENTFCPTTYLYGGLFEFTAATVNRILGNKDQLHPDYHTTRHVMVALFCLFAIIFTGLLAKELAGWRAAVIALLFITLTPRFFGHGLNNPKDIPFAATYIFALYYIIRVLKQLPKPPIKDIVWLAAGIAMSINIRIGGILVIAYLGLFFVYEIFTRVGIKKFFSEGIKEITKSGKLIAVIITGGFFGGVLLWPYGLISPLKNPFQALAHMSKYPINITILFDGKHIPSTEVPWNYILKWMTISNPIFIIIAFALSVGMLALLRKKYEFKYILMVLFTVLFPVGYAIYKESVLYDGWRHFLFIYPSLVVFSTFSIDYLYRTFNNKGAQIGLTVGILILLFLPLKHMVKNHPYEYVYFNEIYGGVNKAFGYYETDYYMASIKEATDWLIENEGLDKTEKDIRVVTNCNYPSRVYLRDVWGKVTTKYTRFYDRNNKHWDYAIFYSRFANRKQLLNKTWPPMGVIYTVKVDDVPVCVVLKNENNSAFLGHEALKKRDVVTAKKHFADAAKYDPNNEDAFYNLGVTSLYTGNFDDAIKYINKSLSIYQNNNQAYGNLGYAYLQKKDFDNAIRYYNTAVQVSPRNPDNYKNMGIAYLNKGNPGNALQCFNYTVQLKPNDIQALNYMAQIFQQQGKTKKAQQVFNKIKQIQGK